MALLTSLAEPSEQKKPLNNKRRKKHQKPTPSPPPPSSAQSSWDQIKNLITCKQVRDKFSSMFINQILKI